MAILGGRRLWTILLSGCLLTLAAPGQGQELSPEEKAAGFTALFNGQDFTNWRFGEESSPQELPPNWKVEDGVIKLAGGGKPHLASARQYANFELRLEWRGLKPKYNSGLYVRSGKKIGVNQINLAFKNEGAPVGLKISGAKAVSELQNPAGEWNEWRVLAVGDKLSLWCNGKEAWQATGFQPAQGYIGMQAEGAPLEFRNIRIRELK